MWRRILRSVEDRTRWHEELKNYVRQKEILTGILSACTGMARLFLYFTRGLLPFIRPVSANTKRNVFALLFYEGISIFWIVVPYKRAYRKVHATTFSNLARPYLYVLLSFVSNTALAIRCTAVKRREAMR